MKIKLKIKSTSAALAAPVSSPATAAPVAKHDNREAWLAAAAQLLSPAFASIGVTLPSTHVSVGFGFARSGTSARIGGQCWDKRASADNVAHVFVSPVIADGETAVAVLAHELVHAAHGCIAGHGPLFRQTALAIGLVGPMRSTTAGDGMKAHAARIIAELGAYPHAKINIADRAVAGVPKQATRMLKFKCAASGYSCRTTQKWVSLFVPPISPASKLPMVAA